MREIKVRVWDIHHNKMLDDLHFDKAVSLNEALNSNEDFIILEYVGLKDINNKKIYANSSIVEFNNKINPTHKYKGYFYYLPTKARYMIKVLTGSLFTIWFYEPDDILNLQIIDTIQENKLGLIK